MDLAKSSTSSWLGYRHQARARHQEIAASHCGINAREAEVQSLSDEDLKTRFAELRARVQEQLKDADRWNRPTSSNCNRRWSRRLCLRSRWCAKRAALLNMRHFDVQLIGGIVLHEGKIWK